MKLGGGVFLWAVIVFIFFRWSARQDHGITARRVVLDDDGNVASVEGPEPLTVDDVQRAFARSGPAPEEPPR